MSDLILNYLVDGFGPLLGVTVGAATTWGIARWRRRAERRKLEMGDARDTIVIQQHLVESVEEPSPEGGSRRRPVALRLRSLGQAELEDVAPNGHLARALLDRAMRVTPRHPLISMAGAEGSYLLETLTNFVCDRVANAPFPHGQYVMAPCCEPADLAHHQPITILLVRAEDLALFEDWDLCRDVRVEHGSDGSRVLTLMELSRRFRAERENIHRIRKAGNRTLHVETIFILDLALDQRSAPIRTKAVPWDRFRTVREEMGLSTAGTPAPEAHVPCASLHP